MDFLTLIQILDSTLRLATPLLLACLAGLFSERAGIFDIGLEGKMLAAAFAAGAFAAVSGSVWVGLLAGIAASLLLSILHGLASITFRGNQLISGVAINFLAAGLTVLIAQDWFRQGGRTPSLLGGGRFAPINLPFAETLSGVPILGPIYAELISGHSIVCQPPGMYSTERGLVCACGPWAKIRQPSIQQAYPLLDCAMRPLRFVASFAASLAPILRRGSKPGSPKT